MIYRHIFETELSDINSKKQIKNKALLRFFENIAGKHSDSLHNGLNDIIDTGRSWVLLEWRLKVLDRPVYGERLEVSTWVRNSTKLYSYRDFEIYSNGVKKVIGSSKWILVDINTLRPMKLNDELLDVYKPEPDKNVFGESEFGKLKEPEAYTTETEFSVRKSDIDINGHVHNLNYVDMAEEMMPDNGEYDYLDIIYKKEIKYGDKLTLNAAADKDGTFVRVCSGSVANALIKLENFNLFQIN
ncbi:MAG: hypothetical protein IJR45_00525 [Firmicutes bacterium]|nr:hypothetical protein [Bacillota bacterium]